MLPLFVLSISPWTRFVNPGSEATCPDLGASLSLSPSPRINVYVVHENETYRISFAVSGTAMTALQLVKGTKGLPDHAAIAFELGAGAAEFWTWTEHGENGTLGMWTPIADFTGGVVSQGGRCDMTGAKDVSELRSTAYHLNTDGSSSSRPTIRSRASSPAMIRQT